MKNMQLVRNKIAAKVQSAVLVVALALLLGSVGWLFGGDKLAFMLITGVVVMYFIGPIMSPALIMKFTSGRRLSPDEAPQIYGILKSLSRKAGLPRLPVLFYMPTDSMLAFTVGPRENATIAISDGLIGRLSQQELAAVIAHEISHVRHNDTRIMAFAGMVSQFTSLLSVFGQLLLLLSLPVILAGQVLVSWPAMFLLIFSPTISSLLQLALSRTREYKADISASELIGSPGPLATALAKIDREHRSLYNRLVWPMAPRLPQASWLRTHPPTKERIRRLLEEPGNQANFQHDDYGTRGPLNRHYCWQGSGRCASHLI